MPRGMPAGKQRELEQPALEGAVAEWRAFRDFEMNERCVPQDVIIISTTLAAAYYLRILERFFSDRPALQEAGHHASSQHHGEEYLAEIKEPSPFIVAPSQSRARSSVRGTSSQV